VAARSIIMDPLEAANHYIYLEQTGAPGAAAGFARGYEERATEAEFDAYLSFIDIQVAA